MLGTDLSEVAIGFKSGGCNCKSIPPLPFICHLGKMEGVYSDYLQPHYVKTYSKVWKQSPYIKALPASSELSQASFPTQEAAWQLLQPLSASPANTPPSADSVGATSPPRSSASPLDPDLPLLSGVPGYHPLAPHFVRRRGREPGRQPPRVPGPRLQSPPPPRSLRAPLVEQLTLLVKQDAR